MLAYEVCIHVCLSHHPKKKIVNKCMLFIPFSSIFLPKFTGLGCCSVGGRCADYMDFGGVQRKNELLTLIWNAVYFEGIHHNLQYKS